MELLLDLLIEWLAANADIKIDDVPAVVVLAEEELSGRYDRPVHALYEDKEETIYLADTVDLSSMQGASVLLHELIHHHQKESGALAKFACIRQSEELAYDVQRKFLNTNNIDLMPELDPFNSYMRTLCG